MAPAENSLSWGWGGGGSEHFFLEGALGNLKICTRRKGQEGGGGPTPQKGKINGVLFDAWN